MKKVLLPLLLIPMIAFTQKVKTNEYDKFIKQRRIEFEPIPILSSPEAKVSLTFHCIGSNLYVQLSGFGWGVSTISAENQVIFLLANDSTVTAKSTGIQSYDISSAKSSYKHQYQIALQDVEALSQQKIVGVRKYNIQDFTDMKVAGPYADNVKKMSTMFIDELKKGKVLQTLRYIDVKDIARYVGDSVEFCSKIFNPAEQPTLSGPPSLFVVANTSNPLLTTVTWEQDRKSFAYQPELLYHNKEVCIRGVVQLYQGKPRIVIRRREQVTVKTPIRLEDVAKYEGDSITVEGRVVSSRYFGDIEKAPTLLFMGAGDSAQLLTVVIDGEDRKNFKARPENDYLNKEVSLAGKVVMVNHKPQMALREQDQIEEILSGTLASTASYGGQAAATNAVKKTTVTSRIAAFPGGTQAWQNFIRENLRVPDNLPAGEKKTVVVRFKVNTDGSITGHEIVESAGKVYDAEVLRVLKKMPNWIPEIQNGQPVAISFKLPITFERIENNETFKP